MEREVNIEIDYARLEKDKIWDGLKGYVTNTKLKDKEVIENYKNLWHIEKAFRMSKTDLRIRPIYHRLKHRIEAHICISFTAYAIYKELERLLYKENATFSLKKAAEFTHNTPNQNTLNQNCSKWMASRLNYTILSIKIVRVSQRWYSLNFRYCLF